MSIIREVQVTGLWQQNQDLTIKLHPDVNFLIGVNGSGKTTVLNLIAAALTADIPYLEKATFSQIRIVFDGTGKNTQALIVEKILLEDGSFRVFYTINSKNEDAAVKRRAIPDYRLGLRLGGSFSPSRASIARSLEAVSKTTWLSIHRFQAGKRDEKSFESSVDSKLSSIGAELVRFFSEIATQGEQAAREFQRQVFASLVPSFKITDLIPMVISLNLEEAETSLTNALGEFGAIPAGQNLHTYFQYLTQVQEMFTRPTGGHALNFEQSAALVMAEVINKIVKEWNVLKETQRSIAEPRETFIQLLSSLSLRKRFFISAKNELRVEIKGIEGSFSLSVLSSGEKQLVIILGEALLQKKMEAIYVADEPELSLHVSWQEKLIDMLRQINPKAQIIFATHSPDIVAHYQDKVFDMETMLA